MSISEMTDGTTVMRYDSARLKQSRKDSWGFLVVDATVCRPGVYPYRQPDGTIRRELKPPEEVFATSHQESVGQAVVTDGHPAVAVTPKNARQLQVGQADSQVTQVGDGLVVTLKITDEDTIKSIDSRQKTQISLGKNVRIDETSGIWRGVEGNEPAQPFDVIQREMTTNHIAVLPHGRVQGARLHLDSGAAEMVPDKEDDTMTTNTMQLTIDGAELTLDTGAASVIKSYLEKTQGALTTAQSTLTQVTGERDALQAKFDQAGTDLTAAKKASTDLQAKLPELVKARQALVAKATQLVGTEKVSTMDGLSDLELRKAVCADKGIELKDRPDAYIEARFDALLDTYDPAQEFARDIAHVHPSPGGSNPTLQQRFDADDKALNDRLDAVVTPQPQGKAS